MKTLKKIAIPALTFLIGIAATLLYLNLSGCASSDTQGAITSQDVVVDEASTAADTVPDTAPETESTVDSSVKEVEAETTEDTDTAE